MKEVKNVNLVKLLPMVRDNAVVYEIENEEMDRDYGDGRCNVDGVIYQMVCYRLGYDDIEYVGWVSEFDLEIDSYEVYKLEDISAHAYTPNEELYRDYEYYYFPATSDEQALNIVSDIQSKLDRQADERGTLSDNDPVLAEFLKKFIGLDEDGDEVWENIEF